MNKCNNCNSNNITHTTVVGRGLPPKDKPKHPNKKISYKGLWDVYTCEDCGNIKKTLRKYG